MFSDYLSQDALNRFAHNENFLMQLKEVKEQFEEEVYSERFSEDIGMPKDSTVAYFSMEYGIHESIPIFSGGLGILAGDHLKAASDYCIPLVGIGLFL